jgi:hypothetical protein
MPMPVGFLIDRLLKNTKKNRKIFTKLSKTIQKTANAPIFCMVARFF